MEPDHPPYWSSQMPQLALHHGELPGVERHQRTYVRYGNTAHATDVTASLGWQKSVSLRTNQCQTADGKLLASLAQLPDAMNMHIVRAPAAFAVPVKQDKRLKPPFKVSLSVTYSARMSCPVVVTAHVLTEADFARVETWMPPEIESSVTMVDRQTATKLKGNRAIEWQYDGDAIGAADIQSAELPTLSELMASSPLNLSNMSITADDALYNMLGTASLAGSDALFDQASLRGASNTSLDPDFLDLEALLNEGPDAASRRLAALNNGNGRRTQALGSRTVSHEFEFGDLEFDKPSRMRKVYIAFACQVGGQDVIYTVFHVPTICVCRREQKERAYQLLGIPYRSDTPVRNNHVRTPTHALQPPAQRMRLDPLHDGERSLSVESDESKQTPDKMLEAARHAPLQAESGWFTASFVSEFILESYAGLGMQRQLTRQDITALLEQAGFPQMDAHNTDARISPEQFEEFKGGWKCILHLLQLIHHCWNKEDPLVVCGFDMDRKHALGALYSEPPGTFLCRFSLSQPGDMVLDLKVPSHSHADEHGVAHAILNVQDLKDHRVDKWIIDYPGATHLLDVSRSRRIDKRRAFHSPYCRFDTLYRFQSMGPDQQEVSST